MQNVRIGELLQPKSGNPLGRDNGRLPYTWLEHGIEIGILGSQSSFTPHRNASGF
jgi:hypothetical protein